MIRTLARRRVIITPLFSGAGRLRGYAATEDGKEAKSEEQGIQDIAERAGVKPIAIVRNGGSTWGPPPDGEKLKVLYKEAAEVFGHAPKQLPLEAYRGNDAQTARNVRKGSKVLSNRLKGPAVAQWYNPPDAIVSATHFRKSLPFLDINDPHQEYRVNMVESRKRRGKGAPKKKRQETDASKKRKGN